MAELAAARGPAPVTLRDFLELRCESSSDGFRSYPRCLPWSDDALQAAPVRLLVEADHHLRRSPSRSSLFSLASRSPGPAGALARISSLSRSFSRRIKEGFWRRREDEDDLYLDDRNSCGFPSPQVSSCSASDDGSESEYAEADDDVVVAIDEKIMACPSTSQAALHCSSSAEHDCTDDAGAAGDGGKKMQAVAADGGDSAAVGRGGKLGMEEDKQQLSPVSVLDFPFDDDDERSDAGTCSPSFHSRTMTKEAQPLHKIRRYDDGIIAQAVDPVDLEARFTTTSESVDASTHPATTSTCTDTTSSSSETTTPTVSSRSRHGEAEHQSVEQQASQEPDEEPDEYRLLARLLQEQEDTVSVVDDEVSQLLLLDFFTEGLDRLCRSSAAGSAIISPRVDRDKVAAEEALMVRAAAEWVRGAGPQWGIRDVMLSGKAALEDMERCRRWMCVGEEEREVGAAVEGFVMDELVDELVEELTPCWHTVMAVDGVSWHSLRSKI